MRLHLSAPYGGARGDVRNAFPEIGEIQGFGYSLSFNCSNLAPGAHAISAVAHSRAGVTRGSSTDFNVVRFDSSYIADPDAVDLSGGSCSLTSDDEISLTNVTVDGTLHDDHEVEKRQSKVSSLFRSPRRMMGPMRPVLHL